MSDASDYLEDNLITLIFRTGAGFAKTAVLAIALATAATADSNTGTLGGNEVANSFAYARVANNPLDANWDAPSNGATANTADVTFATATGSWGTVTHFAILDSATHNAGNLLFHSALTASKAITTDDQPKFAAGVLTVTVA